MSDRFYAVVRALSLIPLKGWIRLRVRGLENIPKQGRLILAANHVSYLDPAVLGRACPRKVHFLIKKSVHDAGGLQWFFRGMDSIPVPPDPRDTSAVRRAMRVLSHDGVVGIFPEGERSADGALANAKTGVALMAARSESPVLPVGIRGAFAAMPPGSSFPRPRRVDVLFGTVTDLGLGGRRPDRARLEAGSVRLMQEIETLASGGEVKRLEESA